MTINKHTRLKALAEFNSEVKSRTLALKGNKQTVLDKLDSSFIQS